MLVLFDIDGTILKSQHAGVHAQPAFDLQRQGPVPEPLQQCATVGGLQHIVQGVLMVGRAHAVGHGQQVKVVIAQQGLRAVAQGHHAAQRGGAVGPPVDQVAQHREPMARG